MPSQDDVIAERYRLVRLIASGGMGVVWEGRDERLRRTVAIKLLRPPEGAPGESDRAARALREARITARLHHPHAVAVFDVVEEGGLPCLIMEYLPSITLADQIDARGPLRTARVVEIGRQIAGALAAAHEAGIVHRDVKPANILLAGEDQAKITDFGISHALGDVSLTSTGLITGTPAYLAPEVARGQEYDARSDVFSLGGTLYAAVEGHAPYGNDANPMALLHRIASSQPLQSRNAGVLTSLLASMLSTEPGARPSMRQVEQALDGLSGRVAAGGERTAVMTQVIPHGAASPHSAPAPAAPSMSDWSAGGSGQSGGGQDHEARLAAWVIRSAGAAVLVVLLIAGLIFWLGQRDTGEPTPGAVASDPATGQSTDAAPLSDSVPSPGSSAAGAPEAGPTATPTREIPSSPPTAGATTSDQSPRPVAPAQAIRDYYAVMPNGTDAGWQMLTSDYQQNHAQGFQVYLDFWAQISSVDVADVQETGPGAVSATITYDYVDGRRYVELTEFTVATEGGTTKIASSTVV